MQGKWRETKTRSQTSLSVTHLGYTENKPQKAGHVKM